MFDRAGFVNFADHYGGFGVNFNGVSLEGLFSEGLPVVERPPKKARSGCCAKAVKKAKIKGGCC